MLSLETWIYIVVLMCKYQSEIQVHRELRKEGLINVLIKTTINGIYSKFLQSGSVHNMHRSNRPSCSTYVIEKNEFISIKTDTSTRKNFKIFNVCHMTIHNILKKNLKLKPYKINYYHALSEEDYAHRAYICEELLKMSN